jgi:hypothetical protein
VNDFCRDRLALDSAIWWLGEPKSTLHKEYRDYVYGISMDPIRCAVTCALLATGRGGYREVISGLSKSAPPGYASGPNFPLDTSILQNNYIRLYRLGDLDGGVLDFDPLHLARFDPDKSGRARATRLSSKLISSTLDDWQPKILSETVLQFGKHDNSAADGQPEGKFQNVCKVSTSRQRLPSRIAYEADPKWPGELRIRLKAKHVGRYKIIIGQLPDDKPCMVIVELDKRPIGFYLTRLASDNAISSTRLHSFTFPVIDSGPHYLSLRVQSGSGHRLDFIEIRRISDIAIQHEYIQKAGVEAILRETIARDTPRGIAREIRSYRLKADDAQLEIHTQLEGTQHTGSLLVNLEPEGIRQLAITYCSGLKPQTSADLSSGAVRIPLSQPIVLTITLKRLMHHSATVEVVSLPAKLPDKDIDANDYPLYFVCESDRDNNLWWTVRGAQREGKRDLVKWYRRKANRDVAQDVQATAWLPNGFRPGWGCQYVLAIAAGSDPGHCRIKVLKSGPFLFAPRVEYRQSIRTVRLNGKDWRYFDEHNIFLPNQPGLYEIEVESGSCDAPTLARTWLPVRTCSWNEASATLHIEAESPAWYRRPLPGELRYTALVLSRGRKLQEVRGAEVLPLERYRTSHRDIERMKQRGFMMLLDPGSANLRFAH